MILTDVRAVLQAGNIGWRMYETQIPDGTPPTVPDDLIALYEYPGSPPEHVKGVRSPVQRKPRFQTVCRSKSATTARAKAEEVLGLLAGFSGVQNGTGYASIRALGEPFPLDRDAAGRARYATNFEAVVT